MRDCLRSLPFKETWMTSHVFRTCMLTIMHLPLRLPTFKTEWNPSLLWYCYSSSSVSLSRESTSMILPSEPQERRQRHGAGPWRRLSTDDDHWRSAPSLRDAATGGNSKSQGRRAQLLAGSKWPLTAVSALLRVKPCHRRILRLLETL